MATDPRRLPPGIEKFIGSEGLEVDGARVDLRSRLGRRWKTCIRNLSDQLGGSITASQGLLLRRVATLSVILERQEAELLNGGTIDEGAYRASLDKQRALLLQLGLAARSRDITKGDRIAPDEHADSIWSE